LLKNKLITQKEYDLRLNISESYVPQQRPPVRLNILGRIVEFYKYAIIKNFGLKSSAELVRFAVKHGIVSE